MLNGAKVFITHAKVGHVFVVMAGADRSKDPKGISAFIIEKGAPRLSIGKMENTLWMRASETSEVILEDCAVPEDQLLGQEGSGFADTMQILDGGRIGIAALSVGLAQGAREAASTHAIERIARGSPIGSFRAIQTKLADNATQIEAA